MDKKDQKQTFTIHKQKIERLILTGPIEVMSDAFSYMEKQKYAMSRVGPKLLGKAGKGIDERRFVLLGEKVIR